MILPNTSHPLATPLQTVMSCGEAVDSLAAETSTICRTHNECMDHLHVPPRMNKPPLQRVIP
ncbi:hypothetical protein B0E46_03865 [Rhodanobacter sp. B04]|uniref:hypothetical protein n=1 Tax=Rhodanobacter sp. B04 TaxID=1945860 RepID=UPI000987A044|nr:hypothetical protein [Rhodanobacter sp. B04]OOG65490.1 hypothetical protein B0E46_03865 [Rhodanobacter sp. B04]